jgi:hypothetical protein
MVKYILLGVLTVCSFAKAECNETCQHTIQVPKGLEDGDVTVCTKDGKCSKFKSNEFAVVPRKQKRKVGNVKEVSPVNQTQTVVVNVTTAATDVKPAVVQKVIQYRAVGAKKNKLGVLVGYAPVGVLYSRTGSNTLEATLKRAVVGGLSYSRRFGSSDWLLNIQGHTNESGFLGLEKEF